MFLLILLVDLYFFSDEVQPESIELSWANLQYVSSLIGMQELPKYERLHVKLIQYKQKLKGFSEAASKNGSRGMLVTTMSYG